MPERETPPGVEGRRRDIWFSCPRAAQCGNCQLNRLPYAAQLRRKQERMEALLGRFCPVAPIIGMEDPMHYRSKVHAVLSADRQGRVFSGVYAAGTHHVVPVRSCLIEDERADAVIRTVTELANRYRIPAYDEDARRGLLRHVLVRTGEKTGQIMAVLVAASDRLPHRDELVRDLLAVHPDITSVVLNVNPLRTSAVLGRQDIVLHGSGWMEDELLGLTFRISPQSFYQVNARQAEVLYRTAIGLAGFSGTETLLDAYCGTGTIGLCAAGQVKRLIGVELNRSAAADAAVNAERNGIANAEFHCADAGRFLLRMARKGLCPDTVILDPPRSGSDEAFLSALTDCGCPRAVYISCGPESLARDLQWLTDHGWQALQAVPVDMFPCTEHVESVVSMSRGGS